MLPKGLSTETADLVLAAARAAGETAVVRGPTPFLFVDETLTDRHEGTALRLHHPRREGIALSTDAPWEGPDSAYFVVVDAGERIGETERYRLYYRGMANRHKPYEGKDEAYRRGGGLGLAILRLDGFASLNASYDGGRVTTKLFRTNGGSLRVNAKADFGRLWVEVLDGAGQPVPGFARDECQVMQADRVDHPITWKEPASLARLADRPIRLRFYLENVRLFSYRIG